MKDEVWTIEYKTLPKQTTHILWVTARSEADARTIANNLLDVGSYKDIEVEDIEIISCYLD